MVGAGNLKAALLEHSGERCHRGAANPNQMDMLLFHECDTWTDAGSSCTAASKFSATLLPTSERRAHAEGQRKTLAGNVARLQPERDRNPQVPQNADDNIAQRPVLSVPVDHNRASRQK